mmetsp:Transcript_18569/g.74623  ORF Transcript_18569/g.74623 Transcript_18569/m.74623 type:complete len:339 (-) Transcript_18569:427-1443(-)
MEVRVCICRHVIVDHNVHSLNIDPPAKNVRRHKNSLLEVLERFVARDSLRLRKPSVHSNRRKVALHKQFVQLRASGYVLYENHNLIELKRIQQVVELTVLFCLLQLQEVLKQSMQCQLRLVVNVNFHWVLHKFFANYSDLLRKGSGEHHHLLVMWGHSEDILNISAHVRHLQHLVALVKNEELDMREIQNLLLCQVKYSSGGPDNHMWSTCGQHLLVLLQRDTAIDHSNFQVRHILRETLEFASNLIRKLSRMSKDYAAHSALLRLQLMQNSESENGRLPHPRLGLTKDISSQRCFGNTFMLNLRGMFKSTILDSSKELGFQQKILKPRGVKTDICAL